MLLPFPRAPVLVWALLFGAGCYSYVPADPAAGALPAGAEVRVELTPLGASRLAALVGPRAVRIDGRLHSVGGDGTITIVPRTILAMDGAQSEWSGDAPLLLTADAVASFGERRLSRRRTIIAAGTATAAAVAIGVAAARWAGDKGGETENPPPPPPP